MWKDLKIPFFTILFIFIGLMLYSKIFGPIPFSVNSVTTTKTSLFTVNGEGEMSAIPDTAFVTLGVNKESSSVQSAQEEVNNIINRITKDIKGLGVDVKDIKTTNYSVNPNYDYSNGKQTLTGYSVSANVEVKLKPIDKANQAIDIATKDGATQVGGVQFVLDDKVKKDLQTKARKEAIKNAKEKAGDISRDAGIKLGRIVDVQEGIQDQPRPVTMMAKAADGFGGAESTELNPGENKVSVSVTISYETF